MSHLAPNTVYGSQTSLACLESSSMDLNSLSCGGQCSPSHLYGTISPCVSSSVILLLTLLISSRFIGAPRSTRGSIPSPILSISTPAGLSFQPSSVRRADLPLMIGSSLPVTPLLSNPPARSILSTRKIATVHLMSLSHHIPAVVPHFVRHPSTNFLAAPSFQIPQIFGFVSPGSAHPVQLLVRWEWFLLRFSSHRRHRLNPNLIQASHALFANLMR